MVNYTLSQFLHRPRRAAGVIAGIALGAALYVALTALATGFHRAAQAPLASVAADLLITRPPDSAEATAQRTRGPRLPFGSTPFLSDEVKRIRSVQGISDVAAALEVWVFGASRYQTVLGVDVGQIHVGPGRVLREGLVSGRVFTQDEPGVAIADRHYAAMFSLKPGDLITIGGQNFLIVGIVDQQDSSQAGAANLYLPLKEAQQLVGLEVGQANQVYVSITDAKQLDAIVDALIAQLGTVSVVSQESILQVMGSLARISTKFSAATALVGIAGGAALAWIALAGLIAERRSEIGLMRAIGWRGHDVTRAFLFEAFLLGLLGGVLGIAFGSVLAVAMSYLPAPTVSVSETLPGLQVATAATQTTRFSPVVSPVSLVSALCIGVGGALVACWLRVRQTTRRKPTKVLYDG